ncbi:hypothetical protein PLICBS_000209 [Purpureocillium lilacinum]|uniref:uncharacterized protein n=1 Tax=Purpureocillium lilacinum TaxID=33203 RepID=UPI00208282CD|nr:hypothetical protein PLICBS_000209 [Purpureocillium lilacinum]
MPALRRANKYRVENPRLNTWKFPTAANSTAVPVSIIDTQSDRRAVRQNSSAVHDYFIPLELAAAAKKVASLTRHPSAANDKSTATAETLKSTYWRETNDTNTPEPSDAPGSGSAPVKRAAATKYWMESMLMNGAAPYAQQGYTVFRNVKDYGAKGDGKTDDTAAINRAVTDGGRCGRECGSSTAKPAVIYFPSGTYLVSSSIIQYYNTQFIGNPSLRPIILAASSFVGLGVISTNVYIEGGNGAEWYIPQNNFMRSIRNFVIDITNTDPQAYVCGIHWQVAQATDLQDIDFYMKPGTTQQGIYMENGSGGSLSKLYFTGGNIGAYLGNQQFTSRYLISYKCRTAIQIHWDWAWTMHSLTIVGSGQSSDNTGITVVGGAGGPGSTGQGVGSLVLVDSVLSDLDVGIATTLKKENSTSFLVQNTKFSNTNAALKDVAQGSTLIAGGSSVYVKSWGFGNTVAGESGSSTFQNGNDIPAPLRPKGLTASGTNSNIYTRFAPTYEGVEARKFINVKSIGAKGDGLSDDTAALNRALEVAANTSSILFIPFGVYMVSDTIRVPVGCRIVGQVWPQIMAYGSNFENMRLPKPVLQVGAPGDAGIVEISDISITTRGATAGAVLVQWNVHEIFKGSVAMWNSPVRLGGSVGSNLQAKNCPKLSGTVNPKCIAASLLIHLTPTSSAYLDNIWAWTADHDLDSTAQEQIDVYSGRGILVESKKPTWLWGTASEHNVLYQYQFSGASQVFVSMMQTESPYFQPTPRAPKPFTPGVFPNDPTFEDCPADSNTCPMAWAARVLDSTDILVYSAGLYSWFSSYSQDCVARENCQARVVRVEQSSHIWLYGLATKATLEMVSPLNASATIAAKNQNGFLSSILAWLEGSERVIGRRFDGWPIFKQGSLRRAGLSPNCEAALYQTVKCDETVRRLMYSAYVGLVQNSTRLLLMCDSTCSESIRYMRGSIAEACRSTPDLAEGVPVLGFVDMLSSRWNETCFKDTTTGKYCNEIMGNFKPVDQISDMPRDELCSYCNVKRFSMMQDSPYSAYDNATVRSQYETIAQTCAVNGADFTPRSGGLSPQVEAPEAVCVSGKAYKTRQGDTCDSIAQAQSISAASLFWINPALPECENIRAGLDVCLPLACGKTRIVQADETCTNISISAGVEYTSLVSWNAGLTQNCSNLHDGGWGHVLCIAPQGGTPTLEVNGTGSIDPWQGGDGYGLKLAQPPSNAPIAQGTTRNCSEWYVNDGGLSCAGVCVRNRITYQLFLDVNPSLGNTTCDHDLVLGSAYCARPLWGWNSTWSRHQPSTTTGTATSSTSPTPTFAWTTFGGSFETSGQRVVAATPSDTEGKAFVSTMYTDFTFEANITIPQAGTGNAGLIFRASNPGPGVDNYSGYYIGFGTDGFLTLGRANRGWTHLTNAQVSIQAGRAYQLVVQAAGASIVVYLDDKKTPKISWQDATYRSGMNGVRVYRTGATFDAIRMYYL